MPLVTGPQAVECAVRAASFADSPLALEHCRCPLNTTQTSQVAFCADIVFVQKIAPNPASNRTVMIVFLYRFMAAPGKSLDRHHAAALAR